MNRSKTLLIAAAIIGCLYASNSSKASLIEYSNDFSSGAALGFGGPNAVETAPNGENFIGFLNFGETPTLDLTGLAAHTSLTIEFDVIGLRSLDSAFSSDNFQLLLNGISQFTDYYGHTGFGGTPIVGPTTGTLVSHDPSALGYGQFFGGASTYHYSLTLPHTAASISFGFEANTDQGWGDEAFGLDNVVVTTNATAPVPETGATLALFGLALTSLGFGRRFFG